jgi:hypothetical protein
MSSIRSAALALALAATWTAGAKAAPAPQPTVVRDVMTGRYTLGTEALSATDDPIQDWIQPDTQIEPSIAVNPERPNNIVTAYQEGRIANGGDATNGFATSFDGGRSWISGELPKLTHRVGQGGTWERASDAVVAFGPGNVVYANSLVFDQNEESGLPSGIATNVSKDGGRTWSAPVVFQDDDIGGLNDKNWIVVDQSDAPGHHKGRVYVVWDRVAPVVYDYCDHDCDQLANWLPNLQTIPGLVFLGQGIGAYPVVMKDGGLGIVMNADSGGLPTTFGGEGEPDAALGEQVFSRAPAAGSTPWPAPLAFLPPVDIASNQTNTVRAQRASDGLPAAAVDTDTGTVYAVWDDGRFRTDGANDAVISSSTDGGVTWSPATRVNPGPANDSVDHYNVTVAVPRKGIVQVAYRQRREAASGQAQDFSPTIDTYFQESRDGGTTWSAPLKINTVPSNALYDAFSRNGSFEGDYNQMASAGGNTYVVRDQGQPLVAGEPPALSPSGATLTLTGAGKGHQHQRTWVALVRDTRPRHRARSRSRQAGTRR